MLRCFHAGKKTNSFQDIRREPAGASVLTVKSLLMDRCDMSLITLGCGRLAEKEIHTKDPTVLKPAYKETYNTAIPGY